MFPAGNRSDFTPQPSARADTRLALIHELVRQLCLASPYVATTQVPCSCGAEFPNRETWDFIALCAQLEE